MPWVKAYELFYFIGIFRGISRKFPPEIARVLTPNSPGFTPRAPRAISRLGLQRKGRI
jgi:hypothetical protein